jgi:hypothetical protein
MSDLQELLRKSLEARRNKPRLAVDELVATAQELAQAIQAETKGKVKLLLDPLKPKEGDGPTFAVLLRLPAEEDRVLRVLQLSVQGYPITVWYSYASWDTGERSRYTDPPIANQAEMRHVFQKLISGPDAEIVRIIDTELAVMQDESGALAGSAAG